MSARKQKVVPEAAVISPANAAGEVAKIQGVGADLGLAMPLDVRSRRALLSGLRASPEFLEGAIAAYEAFGPVLGVPSFDVEGTRAAIALRNAQIPVIEAARTLVAQLEDRGNATYATHGEAALNLYALLKAHTRGGANPAMRTALETMAATLRHRARAGSKTAGVANANPSAAASPSALSPAPNTH
jgi:hypothetical protein